MAHRGSSIRFEEEEDDPSPVSSMAPSATSSSPSRRRPRARHTLTSAPTLSGVTPPGVSVDELGTIQERDKNRALLKELYERFLTKEREWEQFAQTTQTNLQQMVTHHQQTVAKMEQETERKLEAMRLQNQQLQSQAELLGRQNQQLKQELKRESANNFEELKKLTKDSAAPVEAMMHFEQRSHRLESDIRDIRAKLQQKGLFPSVTNLVINYPPEEVIVRPPVGTIDLGEDVFTARLLLRLGFMKARHEARDDDDSGSCRSLTVVSDSDEEHHQYNLEADENVTGVYVPDIKPGTAAHRKVTFGWVGICILTCAIQLLSLTVMLVHGVSGGGCFDTIPSGKEWWFLHLSKGAAMLVAATLMGRQLMEVVNYVMVAELMLHQRSCEVFLTAFLRTTLSVVIICANMAVFRGLTNPADVWMNMTAFAFIASLASDILDVSKRGVFGHDIQRVMTEMSFQLCFMELYPPWFHYVRNLALAACVSAVGVFAFVTFFLPDPLCDV